MLERTGSVSPKNAPQPQPNVCKQPTASIIKASRASARKMGKRVKTATVIMISVNLLRLAATQTVHNASHAPDRTRKVLVVVRRISRKLGNAPRTMFAISWELPLRVIILETFAASFKIHHFSCNLVFVFLLIVPKLVNWLKIGTFCFLPSFSFA